MISFIRMDKKNQMKLRAVCSLLSNVNEDLQFWLDSEVKLIG